MNEFLSGMISALERGERAVFCCIIDSFGSSPRKAGTKMTVFEDGHTVGTVGGGNVEHLAAELAKQLLPGSAPTTRIYDLEGKSHENIGMVCGGAVTIGFRVFIPSELPLLRRWHELLSGTEDAWIRFEPSAEKSADFRVIKYDELPEDEKELYTARPIWKNGVYAERMLHTDRVLLFGGGHVGRALVPVLSPLGFAVTLLDARPELAKPENYPCARNVICSDFMDISRDVTITDKDYVVVMTPGHRADFDILAQVLPCKPAYLGCMGSKRKVAAMREMLLGAGFTVEQIDTIHSPIGLSILSDTPEEIAISIAAEMIKHRAELRAAEIAI